MSGPSFGPSPQGTRIKAVRVYLVPTVDDFFTDLYRSSKDLCRWAFYSAHVYTMKINWVVLESRRYDLPLIFRKK